MIAFLLPYVFAAMPVLHCPEPVADRGEVRSGPPLEQTFQLTNHGAADTIRITGIDAGCGCLRRDLGKETLAPGESTELRIAVNTLTQPEGPNTWRLTVRYRGETETTENRLELAVTARLVREITVTPPAVAFSTSGTARQSLIVRDIRPQPLTVLRAVSTSPHLTIAIQPATMEDRVRTQAIALELAATAPAGTYDETVVLTTSDSACPELRVPVRFVKRSATAVSATPATVEIRMAPGETNSSRLIQCRASGRPVAIENASSDHPSVTVRWANSSGPVATLRVGVEATAGTRGEAQVRITFSEPAGENVTIPIYWMKIGD